VKPSPDIVVVGAGIVGCAVAYELARRGASVRVIESRIVGGGATQASAGVLAPFIEAQEGSALLDLTVRGLQVFDDFVAHVSADAGAVEYRRTGTLEVALEDSELVELRARSDALNRRGVSCHVLDRSAVHADEPYLSHEVAGALLVEGHGFVAASELTRQLARAAEQRGARMILEHPVRRICRQADHLVVETARETFRTDSVVLAAGSWSGALEIPGVSPAPVRPVRGQLLHIAWNGPSLRRVTWSRRCYLVPWADGTVLVGATVEEAGFDERATVAGVRDLLESACDLVPHAWSAGFKKARVGLRPATPDDLPIIGASRALPGLMYATGHYRNGVLLAPLTAQLVADAMLDKRFDPALRATDPARFGDL
jgi:glycine oxidase